MRHIKDTVINGINVSIYIDDVACTIIFVCDDVFFANINCQADVIEKLMADYSSDIVEKYIFVHRSRFSGKE